MKHFYKFAADANIEAERLFRHAIALDPKLAQAHAFLSYAIVLSMLYFDADPDDERLAEAAAIAKKGVEIDDQDALIRFIYGRALLARRAYADALAELTSALELNPGLPVVFSPEIACDFASTVGSAASASAVFRSSTFLLGALGTDVASPSLTIVDDATLPRRSGSRPFDGEGVRSRRTAFLDGGRLTSWLASSYAARRTSTR